MPRAEPCPPPASVLLALALLGSLTAYATAPLFVVPQLEPDDYRYLELVDDLRAGRIGWLGASIIENRWDHLWWIDIDAAVRFFRPTLFASYRFDVWLHGGAPAGLVATNVALMLLCELLAAAVFFRVLAPPSTATGLRPWLPPVLASSLFAAFACHAESLWYIAGRNETLAAAPFLGALALHAWAGRPAVRLLALPCFGLALLGKEVTLALPLVALGLDRVLGPPGTTLRSCLAAGRSVYVGYAAVGLAYVVARQLVLSAAGGSAVVAPYLCSPLDPGYLSHVALQLRAYAENLFFAAITPPFLHPGAAARALVPGGDLLVAAAVVFLLARLRREPRFWFFVALGLLTWLPASVAYVSERYLFLPSFALAGAAGVWLRSARRDRLVALALVGVWIVSQVGMLRYKNADISQRSSETQALRHLLQPVRDAIPRGARVLLVSFPGDVFHAQFVESVLRRELGDASLACRVLSVLPDDPALVRNPKLGTADDHTLEMRAVPALMQVPSFPFPWRPLQPGLRVASPRLGFTVEVLAGDGASAQHLRVTSERPLRDCVLLAFTPPDNPGLLPRGEMIRRGRLQLLR